MVERGTASASGAMRRLRRSLPDHPEPLVPCSLRARPSSRRSPGSLNARGRSARQSARSEHRRGRCICSLCRWNRAAVCLFSSAISARTASSVRFPTSISLAWIFRCAAFSWPCSGRYTCTPEPATRRTCLRARPRRCGASGAASLCAQPRALARLRQGDSARAETRPRGAALPAVLRDAGRRAARARGDGSGRAVRGRRRRFWTSACTSAGSVRRKSSERARRISGGSASTVCSGGSPASRSSGGSPAIRCSSDTSLEGFFDLGQLPIPSGQTTAQYQLSVEAVDPKWSFGMEPYAPAQVLPSGSFAPVVVTVVAGSNAERDILMLQDEVAQLHPGSGSTYVNPAALPQGGAWGSWISGYGSADFFEFTARGQTVLLRLP